MGRSTNVLHSMGVANRRRITQYLYNMTIMIGCPIQRDRAWVLPKYLSAIYNLDYPRKDIHLAFLVNGAQQDNTEDIITKFGEKYQKKYHKIDIWYLYDEHIDHRQKTRDFGRFSDIRNLWISMIRPEDTHIFSLDSDIIVEKDTLTKLLSHDKDIVSALIHNGGYKNRAETYNIMEKEVVGAINDNLIITYDHLNPTTGLREVDLTGACYLIKREVIDKGVLYKKHYQGEDGGFCLSAQKEGFKLFCDQDIKPKHIMEKKENEEANLLY